MIKSTAFKAPYLLDTDTPGSRKCDFTHPTQPHCIQVARDRYLVTFGTLGVLGVDDDRDILYQIRVGQPDGPIIREGRLAVFARRREAEAPGETVWTCNGTPTAFGVPKGARIDGRTAPNENLFVIKWFTDPKRARYGVMENTREGPACGMMLEWCQVRLTDAEDDIEFVERPRMLRQKGYEQGPHFCSLEAQASSMDLSISGPVAEDDTCQSWVEVDHFRMSLAAVRFRFNPRLGRYEWTDTGPLFRDDARRIFEASLVRHRDEWLVMFRTRMLGGETGWIRTRDPFCSLGNPVYRGEPKAFSPRMAYTFADGVIRVSSGHTEASPYGEKRNPLYLWDLNPADFTVCNRRVIFDAYEGGIWTRGSADLADSQGPFVHFLKLFPARNNRQLVAFTVYKGAAHADSETGRPRLRIPELAKFGAYTAEIEYESPVPDAWTFANR